MELILGLHCILSLLELVHTLISIPKRDVYSCDFIEAIWMCKCKLYQFYNDLKCQFKVEAFIKFHSLLVGNHDGLDVIFVKSPIDDNDWCDARYNGHQALVHSWE